MLFFTVNYRIDFEINKVFFWEVVFVLFERCD